MLSPSEALSAALDVRRGQLDLATLPPEDRYAVRQTLRSVTDAQLGRLAEAQEHKRGRRWGRA